MVNFGVGIKPAKRDKAERLATDALTSRETLVALVGINSLRPMADVLVFTDARILALDLTSGTVKAETSLEDITDYTIAKSMGAAGNLIITASDQSTAKWPILKKEDFELVESTLKKTASQPNTEALSDLTEQRKNASFDAGRALTKEERKAGKARDKAEAAARQAEREKRDKETYGTEVERRILKAKTVVIYTKGYVRVGGLFGLGSSPYERLLSIEDAADITKKTGLGRTVMAGATLGMNLVTSSNRRGDAYLVIVTDQKTHTIHVDTPSTSDLKAVKALAAAGRSVLAQNQPTLDHPSAPLASGSPPPPTEHQTVTDQLREAASLHAQGVLTDDEFAQLKARLLSEM